MRQLSALDRLFLTQERPGTPMHISVLLFYSQQTAPGGRVRFRDIVKVFADRAHEVPLLHLRVQEVPFELDNPYWVHDDHFNIESHVNHVALPKPGDWRQLCIMAARIHARPVDRSRPLWEATVIEGLDNIEFLPRGSFAILLKMHHAAVDGIAARHALEVLHDTAPVWESKYHYNEIYPLFKFRVDYPVAKTWVSVLSNHVDVEKKFGAFDESLLQG